MAASAKEILDDAQSLINRSYDLSMPVSEILKIKTHLITIMDMLAGDEELQRKVAYRAAMLEEELMLREPQQMWVQRMMSKGSLLVYAGCPDAAIEEFKKILQRYPDEKETIDGMIAWVNSLR